MDPRILRLKTDEECENFERNALKAGEKELAKDARQRKIEIKATSFGSTSTVERECLEAIYAYEETLFAKNGKRTRATRTWNMLARRGILPAVETAVGRRAEAQGFRSLHDMGLTHYAFEAVILRHPSHFSAEVVEISQRRMKEWGT